MLDEVKRWEELSRYEGFNSRALFIRLLNRCAEYNIHIRQNPDRLIEVQGTTTDGNIITMTNNKSFAVDLSFMCMIFMTREAAIEKMMNKSSNFLKNCMRILKDKYQINTAKNPAGVPLGAAVVTLPRIVASSPITVVRLFISGVGRSIVDPTSLFPGVILPRAVMSPMITSMLPQLPITPFAVFFAISVKLDNILH